MTILISNLLDMIRVKGTTYLSKNVQSPWGMAVQQHEDLCRFHIVISGSTWIGLADGGKSIRLTRGDFAIIPRGKAHFLEDEPRRKILSIHRIPDGNANPEIEKADHADEKTHLVCGYFQFAQGVPSFLISRLPDILVTKAGTKSRSSLVHQIVALLTAELSQRGPSQQMVLNRLTEILFFHAIKEWFDQALLSNGALNALADPKLQRVLGEIHQDPANNWTVESLAGVAGQSRAAFASHFKQATGVSPITYVTLWRTEMARKLLSQTAISLDEVASKTGYQDTNAFSRAFKRVTGSSPGAFRQAALG